MGVGRWPLVLVAVALADVRAAAWACTSASCSLASRAPGQQLRRGSTRVEISYRYADADRPMYDGDAIPWPALRPRVDHENGLIVPGFHQELAQRGQAVQIDVSHAVTSRLVLTASFPALTRKSITHVLLPGGDPRLHEHLGAPGTPNTYSLDGIGDAQLSASHAFRLGGHRLVPGLAWKLASGRSDFDGPDGGLADPMAQPGTGAIGIVGSLRAEGRLAPLAAQVTGFVSHQRNRADARGYRFGAETIVVAGLTRRISGPLSGGALIKMQHGARNVFRGRESISTGGLAVSAAPSLRYAAPAGVSLSGTLQLPLRQRPNEYGLGARMTLTIGISKEF